MAWGKAGSTTLTTTGDTITVSDTTASDFNQTLSHVIQTSSNIRMATRVGNGSIDSGSNYANGSSENGGAKSNATSQTYHKNSGSVASDMFTINYAVNIATEEKLFISHNIVRSTAGAGTAPQRMESVGKWVNTSNQFNYIETVNDQAGDYTTDSNLTALGSDLTPAAAVPALGANIQVGSRYEETDTRKMYDLVVPSITLDEDFSSDNWTDNDSTNIGVSGGALSWNAKRDNTNDASSRDLGSVASDKWVLRFKLTQGSSIGSVQAGNRIHFGISDSDYSVAQNAVQDYIGVAYYYDHQSTYKAQDSDGAIVPESGGDSTQNITISANDVYYFEIIRNGSSYTVEAFTNSDYSTGSLGKLSGTTTASGLRYLKIMNTLPAQGAIPTSTNPFDGTIDDLKFYDGVTQTTSYWQEIGT